MYISDKFVYLELEKTGSTHVIRMLQKFEHGGVIEGKHNRMSKALLCRIERHGLDSQPLGVVCHIGCESQGGLFLRQTGMGFKGYGMREHPWFALCSILHQPLKPIKRMAICL